ncbi:hypothetical protein C8J57DRAFT_1533407 [Mycena rebaudengoi]|nr:hypothetical protein C8J57DRAFT_1533407 [Mycena rebaudengoi]
MPARRRLWTSALPSQMTFPNPRTRSRPCFLYLSPPAHTFLLPSAYQLAKVSRIDTATYSMPASRRPLLPPRFRREYSPRDNLGHEAPYVPSHSPSFLSASSPPPNRYTRSPLASCIPDTHLQHRSPYESPPTPLFPHTPRTHGRSPSVPSPPLDYDMPVILRCRNALSRIPRLAPGEQMKPGVPTPPHRVRAATHPTPSTPTRTRTPPATCAHVPTSSSIAHGALLPSTRRRAHTHASTRAHPSPRTHPHRKPRVQYDPHSLRSRTASSNLRYRPLRRTVSPPGPRRLHLGLHSHGTALQKHKHNE